MKSNRTLLRLRIYFNWLLINVGFCLLPIFISYWLSEELNDNIVSSSISYSFTLLIVSLYLFDRFSEPESSFKWLGILVSFFLIALFIIYPELLNDRYKLFLREHMIAILVLILTIALIFSFFLNLKPMNESAEKLAKSKKFDEAKETSQTIDDWIKKQKSNNE